MILTTQIFHEHILSRDWYKPSLKLLVACSGGVDSTVLLHLLSQRPNYKISVVHFDHQLRGKEGEGDRSFVQDLARDLGHDFYLCSANIETYAAQHGLSVEEAGSMRRRKDFNQLREDLGYDYVVTGQHMDDQIETILMNLFQGTGIHGLSGTREVSHHTVRPLLPYYRADIEKYAHEQGLEYRVDSSNMDTVFLRNNFRSHITAPLLASSGHQLSHTIRGILHAGINLNTLIERCVESIDIKRFSDDYVSKIALGMDGVADYFSAIQKAIFDRAFQLISMMPQGISTKHFNALVGLIANKAIGKEVHLPGGVTATRNRKHMVFFRHQDMAWSAWRVLMGKERKFPFFHTLIEVKPLQPNVLDPTYFWLDETYDDYELRPHRNGDRLVIDAQGKSLSAGEVMQSAQVAPHLKAYYPVLERRGEVLWIPGIRTAYTALVPMGDINPKEEKHCMRINFQEGTFE